jgi:hypothetical protein
VFCDETFYSNCSANDTTMFCSINPQWMLRALHGWKEGPNRLNHWSLDCTCKCIKGY